MAYDASSFAGRGGAQLAHGTTPQRSQGQAPQQSNASKSRSGHPLRPVTIRQLYTAERVGDGVMIIDGKEIGQVCIVGRIVEHEQPQTSGPQNIAKFNGYKITDGSGLIVVRQWLEPDTQTEPIGIGSYLRASGTVKMWQDKPMLTGTIKVMMDNNEMTFHFLDAIHTHLRLVQGHRAAPASKSAAATAASPGRAGGPMQQQQPAYMQGGAAPVAQATDLESAVQRALMASKNRATGMSFNDICAMVTPAGYSAGDIKGMLRTMVGQGVIYTTDDVHYAF